MLWGSNFWLSHTVQPVILTQEGEGWYVASKVASLADVYANNRATVISHKAPEGKSAKVVTAATSEEATAGQSYRGGRGGQYQPGRDGLSGPQSSTQTQKVRRYRCGELGHISRDCPQDGEDEYDSSPSFIQHQQIRRYACRGYGHIAGGCPGGPGGGRGECGGPLHRGCGGNRRAGRRRRTQNGAVRVGLVSTGGATQGKTREMGVRCGDGGGRAGHSGPDSCEFGDHPIVGTVCAYDASTDLCAYSLRCVGVAVSECGCVALKDSGCQISLVSN